MKSQFFNGDDQSEDYWVEERQSPPTPKYFVAEDRQVIPIPYQPEDLEESMGHPKEEEDLPYDHSQMFLSSTALVPNQFQDSLVRVSVTPEDLSIPYTESLAYQKTKTQKEFGCFLGRSFRVCFGPNGMLVHPGKALGLSSAQSSKLSSYSTVHIEKLVAYDPENKPDFPKLLSIHKDCSRPPNEEEDRIRWDFQDTQNSISQIIYHSPPLSPAWNLFSLVNALVGEAGQQTQIFSQIPNLDDHLDKPSLGAQARKITFDKFLKKITEPRIQREIKKIDLKLQACSLEDRKELLMAKIFIYLTGRQIENAVNTALEIPDYSLSCLLAQATCNFDDYFLQDQIELWENNMEDEEFEFKTSREKVFGLLAGKMDVCFDLGWKRALILFSSFQNTDRIKGVPEVIQTYVSAAQHDQTLPPLSEYLQPDMSSNLRVILPESPQKFFEKYGTAVAILQDGTLVFLRGKGEYFLKSKNGNWKKSDTLPDIPIQSVTECGQDGLFNFMRFFSFMTENQKHKMKLSNVVSPSGFSPYALDVCLSWHLYSVLFKTFSEMTWKNANKLSIDYAHQLEIAGHWRWAIYVLSHSISPQAEATYPEYQHFLQESAIKNILSRHACDFEEDEMFLTLQVGVPIKWIYQARGYWLLSRGETLKASKHLFMAEEWNEVHQILIGPLSSELLLKSDFESVSSMLARISDYSDQVTHWEIGGMIFLDYLSVCTEIAETLSNLSTISDQFDFLTSLLDILKHGTTLSGKLSKLSSFSVFDQNSTHYPFSFIQRVCYSQMTSSLLKLISQCKALSLRINLSQNAIDTHWHRLAPLVPQLPVIEDTRLTVVHDLTNDYLDLLSY